MSKPRDDRQKHLLLPALDQIIDMGHPLVRSAALIDRKFLDDRFGSVCQTGPGHPGISEKAAYPQAVSSAVVIIPA
jgi:IS5 family transposase